MGVKITLEKQKGSGIAFTFPLDMTLNPEVAKMLKLEPALRRIAKGLLKQHRFAGSRDHDPKKIIGVEFHEIGFSYILEPAKSDEQRVAEKLMEGS